VAKPQTRRPWRAALASAPSATRWLTGALPLAILSALLLAALVMMTAATQNSAVFGRLYSWLLVTSVLGIGLLVALLVLNVLRLVGQYRARVPGSRLTMRLLILFVLLAGLPVSGVFFFSIQTLHRGIDSWFDVRIDQALDDALKLGRTTLEAVKQDRLKDAQEMAAELEILSFSNRPGAGMRTLLPALDSLREQHGVNELTLFGLDGRILAASSEAGPEPGSFVPDRPREAVLAQVRQGQPYVNVEVVGRAGLRLRVVVPVYSREVGAPLRVLQLLQALPPRYAKLGESVQSAFAEYEKLDYLRGPLKFGLTLTLTLVALLTLLIAVWAAIFTARRVVAPIRDLAEGTRAVARGNYRLRLPITTHDEIGVLVASFNDMTRRIHRAQTQIKKSQHEAERARAYLETVLAHLSSGVLSIDARGVLRTYNAAAAQILGVALDGLTGTQLARLADDTPTLTPFVQAIEAALSRAEPEWVSEIALEPDGVRRVLMVRGTRLPGLGGGRRGGYVVVFDEVTALIQAQRHAAWSEVARRMAHEIKNPLTPIQLSAERIRHKYLKMLPEEERATLERATHTIVEQVTALKSMVNAFADYARPAQMLAGPVNLNDLVRDVVELYIAGHDRPVDLTHTDVVPLRAAEGQEGARASRTVVLRLALDRRLPAITADAGRLRQVLHNLLINARDALTGVSRPVIRLATRQLEEAGHRYVELTIQDNGPGFPAGLLPRLFEPYVTTKEKGTGLGLAIVKRIVEEHGGQIRAENLKDGGACVTMRLPLTEAAAAPAETSASRAHKRTGRDA
jgi:PAS domain S-box-containing protein